MLITITLPSPRNLTPPPSVVRRGHVSLPGINLQTMRNNINTFISDLDLDLIAERDLIVSPDKSKVNFFTTDLDL